VTDGYMTKEVYTDSVLNALSMNLKQTTNELSLLYMISSITEYTVYLAPKILILNH